MYENFSKRFTFMEFLKFVSPAIISMVFMSLYTIIDGIFVSVLVGSNALASINIILPAVNIIFGIGIMMGTGGGALVAKNLGENKFKEANGSFSLIFIFSSIVGILLCIIGIIFIKDISIFLGATEKLLPYCIDYGYVTILFTPIFIMKLLFEFFIRTDGNFKFSLFLSIISGITNIALDYILIKIFGMGIAGAAWATGIGCFVSVILGFYYFLSSKSKLKFTIPKFDFKVLLDSMSNGSSEMVTELSTGITTLLFNMMAIKYAGENGLAALTIILYAHFLMVSTYLGLVAGVSPIFSYNYGAENASKIKETYNYSKKFILASSLIIFVISIVFAPFIVSIFVSKDSAVFKLSLEGLKIFAIAFLFIGMNVFASGLFTSFSNGKISALISFSRSFIFIICGMLILPNMFDLNGLWLTVPFAEIITIVISLIFIKKYKKEYMY